MKSKTIILISVAFLIAITAPFLIGLWQSNDSENFAGFLANPIDGHTYLAKMAIGETGNWLFRLPYSVEEGSGAYLFLFYIFLGHVAAFLNVDAIYIFHGARIAAAGFLLLTIYWLAQRFAQESNVSLKRVYFFSVFGSGLGWLFIGTGNVTSDFWVAEMYPFLSSYTNPHFPLGLGLMLWSFNIVLDKMRKYSGLLLAVIYLALAVILPFGVVIAGVIVAMLEAINYLEHRQIRWKVFLSFLPGVAFVAYQYISTLTDPILNIWNTQNQTPAPNLLDLVISLSPLLILALPGLWIVWRKNVPATRRLMAIWLVTGLVLMFFPINIQRRFSTGIIVPAAFLAEMGITYFVGIKPITGKIMKWFALASLPTLIFILLIGIGGVSRFETIYFVNRDEKAALNWIKIHTPSRAVILTSPESGLLIPAYTARRVIYGHPFETINAEIRRNQVQNYYEGSFTLSELLQTLPEGRIDYILMGSREKRIGSPDLSSFERVFRSGDVEIYATGK